MEKLTLSDKQVASLFNPKSFSVVEWVLKEHRMDYKATFEDVKKCLTIFDDDLMINFLALFKERGFGLSPRDFLWVLQTYDFNFHSNGANTLAERLVVQGLFQGLDEVLKEASAIPSSSFEKLYVTKVLKHMKSLGLK